MFSMNNLEKTNLLSNKNPLQFYYIFKFQYFYIILISYIRKYIYEFKPNNYNLLICGRLFVLHMSSVTSLASRFSVCLLYTLAKLKGDREILTNT